MSVRSVTLSSVDARTPIGTRQERKQRTRQALLQAALDLLEDRSFGSLSLREVAREAGIVPTAFYRHFASMEELGIALIDESFRALRQMLRDARSGRQGYAHVIRNSLEVLVRHVHEHRQHFRFIARHRGSGVTVLRHAIRAEIRLISSELATDLARFPALAGWTTEDLQMMAGVIVNAMVSTIEELLDAPADNPEAEDEIVGTAERQLRLIALGVPAWRSG
jgi:AcrR family transcriptional regulator